MIYLTEYWKFNSHITRNVLSSHLHGICVLFLDCDASVNTMFKQYIIFDIDSLIKIKTKKDF